MTLFDLKSENISVSKLDEIPVPVLEGKSKHVTVQFGTLARLIIDTFKAAELRVTSHQWQVGEKGNVLYGSVDILHTSMQGPSLSDHGYFTFSVRTSNNNHYGLTFLNGARVNVVEDEQYFCLGQAVKMRRNTESILYEEAVEFGINKFIRACDKMQATIDRMIATPVTPEQGSHIILLTCSEGDMNITHAKGVFDSWLSLYEKGNNSAWDLWTCFRSSLKRQGAPNRFDFCRNLYPRFSNVLSLETEHTK